MGFHVTLDDDDFDGPLAALRAAYVGICMKASRAAPGDAAAALDEAADRIRDLATKLTDRPIDWYLELATRAGRN
jgi:hypothetical protein